MINNILEYDSFLNESMDPESATNNIIELVTKVMGWIDPNYAIEIFTDLTGISPDDQEVDSMLAILSDEDLLYYEDDSVSNNKGKKVKFGDIEMKEYPHRSSDGSVPMQPTHESLLRNLVSFNDFN
jgi:hypothetical protein